MPQKIKSFTLIKSEGNKPKIIKEYFGRVNTESDQLSLAKMESPSGWVEPGQRPEFDEYTFVLKGELHVETESGEIIKINSGEAILTRKGEWIRYSTPGPVGAEYIAVCLPAFSPDTVHRDKE